MIHYACPACNSALESPEEQTGQKVGCPHCGQHLLVPAPLGSKTVLGKALPDPGDEDSAFNAVPSGERNKPGQQSEDRIPSAIPVDRAPPQNKQAGEKFCHECGARIRAKAVICPKCGVKQPSLRGQPDDSDLHDSSPETNRVAAGVIAILLGALGIHKFILGFPIAGIIMLLVTVLTCGWGGIVMGIIGLVEGILYLSKSDREFYKIYVVNKREWF